MTWTPKACGSVERRSRRIRMIRTWIPRNFSRTPKAPALQPGPDAMVKDLLPIHLFRRNACGAPVRAFSSEVDTGFRKENAPKQKPGAKALGGDEASNDRTDEMPELPVGPRLSGPRSLGLSGMRP